MVAAVLMLAACTSADTAELLETHPELSDLQLQSAERVDRWVHSSNTAAFPTGNEAVQYFVPVDESASFDDVVDEAVGIAEGLGWDLTFYDSEVSFGQWYGCRPAPSDSELGHSLRIGLVRASTTSGQPQRVKVALQAGRAC